MITKGAVAALVAAIVALLVKMRDLNSELMRKLASNSRKLPPSEAMRRLQMELPFLCAAAANDSKSKNARPRSSTTGRSGQSSSRCARSSTRISTSSPRA